MNRGQLVTSISKQTGLTKKVSNKTLSVIIEDIKKSLKKEPGGVRLVGFGTFKKATRKPRVGRNPQTGEAIKIAKKTYAKFVPSKTWKLV